MANINYYINFFRGSRDLDELSNNLLIAKNDLDLDDLSKKNLIVFFEEISKSLLVKSYLKKHWNKQHRVNGAQHCQNEISCMSEYDEVFVFKDPFGSYTGNKHEDPNALAVFSGDGKSTRLGYVSAKPDEFGGRKGGLTKWLSDRIDNEKWKFFISAKVGQGKASLGLRIHLIQINGDLINDWPENVKIEESLSLVLPNQPDIAEMDSKLTEIFINRNMLGEEARYKLREIRSFRIKYGRYSENCLNWLDTQIENINSIMI